MSDGLENLFYTHMYSSGPSYLASTLRVIGVHLTARFDGKIADEGEITD